MSDIESGFILLFVAASAVAIVARRVRLPYTVALVLTGLILGALHAFQPPELTKEMLFAVVLPGLLFEAGFHLDFHDFRRDVWAIVALAVPGVVAAIGLTALILGLVANTLALETAFTWSYALVFGAVVAATDPIAVVGLFRSVGAPKRLSVLLEGESLFNDGTAIVFFTLILASVTGAAPADAGSIVRSFLMIVGGGALIGALIGLVISEVVRRVDDPMIEITLTTIAAYGSFVTAEGLNFSGVIATVAAGMLCGNYGARTGMSPSTRVSAETFWEYVAFALNSIVFLLIGFRVQAGDLLQSWLPIIAAYLAVTVGRAIVVLGVSGLLGPTRRRLPTSWSVVLTWGGVRGGLSMVLALALPASLPHRDFLVTTTFGVVILSILAQGLTMSWLLRRLGIVRRDEAREQYERLRARVRVVNAALAELDAIARQRSAPSDVVHTLRQEYEARMHKAEDDVRQLHVAEDRFQEDELLVARRHLLITEKDYVLAAARRGDLDEGTANALLSEIDGRLVELAETGAERPRQRPDAAT
jgi:CPA1 family monovalent cation:H+ antiporter